MSAYDSIIIERVNNGDCPICVKPLGTDITFVDHNGTKQPVHTSHIQVIQDKGTE